MENLRYRALMLAAGLTVPAVIGQGFLAPAQAAEKMVGPDGKVLYYLHEGGRVSDPSGRTKGYIKGDRYTDKEGRTKGYLSGGGREVEREFDEDGYDQNGHHEDEK